MTQPLAGPSLLVPDTLPVPPPSVPITLARLSGLFRRDFSDAVARVLIGGLFLALSIRIARDFLATGRTTGLLLLASELLVVVLTVIRRPASVVDRRWHARLVTAISIAGPLVVRPATTGGLLADGCTAAISACGLFIVIVAKLSLGRSFGVMPANRGIICSGLYRIVRHPIYAGYVITDTGFLLAHPTWWNAVALVGADVALVVRALYEERTLGADAAYADYLGRVRWRIVPGVF
jgi:protein-S-isoprenylcysteine O-methyltransferase Ste14